MVSSKSKNLALAGGAVALAGIIAVNLLLAPATTPASPSVMASPASAGESQEVALPSPSVSTSGALSSPGSSPGVGVVGEVTRREYAIGLQELRGLPPDARPGTSFELWVTWEPPVTEDPRLQRLIADVVLERVIPGPVPEAPVTALLSVPAERAGDLIYADTYGRLNVVLPHKSVPSLP